MEKNVLFQKLNKQIEVYKDFITQLEKVKSSNVLQKFDNKVLNVRFKNALNDIALSQISFYLEGDFITMFNDNRRFKGEHSTIYVDYHEYSVEIAINDKRIDSNKLLEYINVNIESLKTRIKNIEKSILEYDNMVLEYNKICKSMLEFKSKYDNCITQNHNFRNYCY